MYILVVNHYNRAIITPQGILEDALNACASSFILEQVVHMPNPDELQSFMELTKRNVLNDAEYLEALHGELGNTQEALGGEIDQEEYELYRQRKWDLECIIDAFSGKGSNWPFNHPRSEKRYIFTQGQFYDDKPSEEEQPF
jgi:hypothetical protein